MFNFDRRNVVTGLEGCGKSSRVFEQLIKTATRERPILFAFKNYKLMVEQRDNWSKRYGIPIDEFAICGTNQTYEPALEAYTNPEQPKRIPLKARVVMCTQNCLQKNAHINEFIPNNTQFSHIVVDEFDLVNGIIPTLDYQMGRILDAKVKELTKINLVTWVLYNYTLEDYRKIQQHGESFFLAHWIESSECPITFLTSEKLATELLKLLGFTEHFVSSPDYKHCVVRTWVSHLISRDFFKVFNENVIWNKLGYDVIITDSVSTFFSKNNDQTLTVNIISHTGARGSNEVRDKNILTILSHIPNEAIKQIRDVFNAFGRTYDYDDVVALFYRDRLCQAIGRTLGNRGAKVTDLWIHSSIMTKLNGLEEFPYTFSESLEPDVENLKEMLVRIEGLKSGKKVEKVVKHGELKIKTYEMLNDFFEVDANNIIPVSEIKEFLERHQIRFEQAKNSVPVSKVAKHFGAEVKNIRISGSVKRCVVGINYKF